MAHGAATGDDRRKPRAPAPGGRGVRAPAPSRRDEFLTPNQVADRLLVAPVTVRLWASKGLLPSVTTPGGHRRFSVRDVEAFVALRQVVQETPRQTPSRVLIIDDDAQFARYLENLLSMRMPGLRIDTALDGFSAGIKCEALRPDVVTLDLQMPDMNGFEVCRLLRRMFGRTKPRIVALTGYPSRENVEQIMAAGADACLAKTARPEELIREIGCETQRAEAHGP